MADAQIVNSLPGPVNDVTAAVTVAAIAAARNRDDRRISVRARMPILPRPRRH
ncbi:hypothetical protein [Nocardia terpenica]|uniref:Uncharacterized protein n=1 Tax=Nocardia terpenica TaxID=455432 RepID=A0A6G9Z9Q6_9NOCA|nr:hypothetical protein [Nocardia terpenica]QIS22325.1 hypothetical protein F6W96_32270 [Nocardia terpenica]